MGNTVVDMQDTLILNLIARSAGVTLKQARMVLDGVAGLPAAEGDSLIERRRMARITASNERVRKGEASERARQRARSETP